MEGHKARLKKFRERGRVKKKKGPGVGDEIRGRVRGVVSVDQVLWWSKWGRVRQ